METKTRKAGYSIAEWCPDAGISRATYYALAPESRPHSVSVGAREVITESAADWLARVRDAGGAKVPPRKKRTPATATPGAA